MAWAFDGGRGGEWLGLGEGRGARRGRGDADAGGGEAKPVLERRGGASPTLEEWRRERANMVQEQHVPDDNEVCNILLRPRWCGGTVGVADNSVEVERRA